MNPRESDFEVSSMRDEYPEAAALSASGEERRLEIRVLGERALARRIGRRRLRAAAAIAAVLLGSWLVHSRVEFRSTPQIAPQASDRRVDPSESPGPLASVAEDVDHSRAEMARRDVRIEPPVATRVETISAPLARVEVVSLPLARPERFAMVEGGAKPASSSGHPFDFAVVSNASFETSRFLVRGGDGGRIAPVRADQELLGLLALAGRPSGLLRIDERLVVLPLEPETRKVAVRE